MEHNQTTIHRLHQEELALDDLVGTKWFATELEHQRGKSLGLTKTTHMQL
jgi:hypothetical protein